MKNEPEALDKHHTHFILLDDGCYGVYLDDRPRSDFVEAARAQTKCYAVTIIVDGGLNTIEVILRDLDCGRPIVIIHRSGRLANLLGNFLKDIDDKTIIE